MVNDNDTNSLEKINNNEKWLWFIYIFFFIELEAKFNEFVDTLLFFS